MLVVTNLATPIAVATACEFSSCVTCAEKEDIVAAATCGSLIAHFRYERCWVLRFEKSRGVT